MSEEPIIEITNAEILPNIGRLADPQRRWLDKVLDSAAAKSNLEGPARVDLRIHIVRLLEKGYCTLIGTRGGVFLELRVNPGVDNLPVY